MSDVRVRQRDGILRRMERGPRAWRLRREDLIQRPRIWKYRAMWTCRRLTGNPVILQPVLFLGQGEIVLGRDVVFGWRGSPLYYTGYSHVEASGAASRIEVGDGVVFSNNVYVKSEGAGIQIGPSAGLGAFVEVIDSDFHDLDPRRHWSGTPDTAPVVIGPNVMVMSGTRVLKGVTIGEDSIIGVGSVVTSSIPAGVLAAGAPARIVREL